MSLHIGHLKNGNYAVLQSTTESKRFRVLVECESYEEAVSQAKLLSSQRCTCGKCNPPRISYKGVTR